MSQTDKICAVVLAAGKGTRMKSELPKVATLLNGKPLLLHVLDNLIASGIKDIYVVVGFKKEVVMDLCKSYTNIHFVEQKEQLGTGHALLCCENSLKDFQGNLLVACGDVPLLTSTSFKNLANFHLTNHHSVTVLSAEIDTPKGYGRLIRNNANQLLRIVEEKDATDEERNVKEINTGTYIFNSPEVFQNLKKVNTENAQGEYYLPDLVKIANLKNEKTGALVLNNHLESSGVNSPEDLQRLESYIAEGKIAV
ncbi:MAG TPA: NTP transferase domain-containing protein [Leptospiraceae bacterium]|nr:NTP transferase domain-containing protein [Leptospiraceae bacterium]HMW07725.1 NTP transferase domain-containing protein [Leptospiraceae bacterium]HMX32005.1 NTP transferase domain-containing protein [Leptospiraceae bacterium]HMY33391.1 NTP transferase domain-containing protein [Leptospiraceae bacterium]HMZ64801.1 NTP transferase domain-containing protein [Leptospiraceae bacterium]